MAGYLNALVRCLGEAVEKQQLIMGKPTSREEVHGEINMTVTERMEHYFKRYTDAIEGEGYRIIDEDSTKVSGALNGAHDGDGVGQSVDP